MALSQKEQNRAHLWALAKTHETFTKQELAGAARRSEDFVHAAIRDWVEWGYVEEAGQRGNKKLWKITGKAGDPGRKLISGVLNATPEERMWFAIRKCGSLFCARDVAMWSNAEDIPITVEAAHGYCRNLLAGNYLRCDVKADGKGAPAYYRLIRDTGPRAPIERRVRALLDPNRNELTLLRGRAS